MLRAFLGSLLIFAALVFHPSATQASRLDCPPGETPARAPVDCQREPARAITIGLSMPGSTQAAVAAAAGEKMYLPIIQTRPAQTAAEAELVAEAAETGHAVPEPESQDSYHTVQRGESLQKIARNYNITLEELVLANAQIANPDRIYVGDRIKIPTTGEIEVLRSEEVQRQEVEQELVVADTPHDGERWVDVDLASQTVRAYEGDTLVQTFLASTGTAQYPTVTGQYKIWIKFRYDDMRGPGYYLTDVPYVMYFYKGYALHGTYWHDNFGTPMSHGCVNLRTEDAEWLFGFSHVGMLVNVH